MLFRYKSNKFVFCQVMQNSQQSEFESPAVPASPRAMRSGAGAGRAAGLKSSEGPLGILTKYSDTFCYNKAKQTQKFELVEDRIFALFDQNVADFEKWAMLQQARDVLSHDFIHLASDAESSTVSKPFKSKDKRVKNHFSELILYSDLDLMHLPPPERIRHVTSHLYSYLDLMHLPPHQRVCWTSGARANRFTLSRVVEPETGEIRQVLRPKFRVINCCSQGLQGESPEIWRSSTSGRCNFHKVVRCGSIWTCIVCSSKVSQHRKTQIKSWYEAFISQQNGDALMITFTVKHGLGDAIVDTLQRLKIAFGQLSASYSFKNLTRQPSAKGKIRKSEIPYLQYLGHVTATEITWSSINGWHPHLHVLFFFDKKSTLEDREIFRSKLFSEWHRLTVNVGLPSPLEFNPNKEFSPGRGLGVDVIQALSAEEYISKSGRGWSIESEMVSHSKKVSRKGFTPFQLLRASMETDSHKFGINPFYAKSLFIDYAIATSGSHQLEVSRRLSARLKTLNLDSVVSNDIDVSESLASKSKIEATLTARHWIAIRKSKSYCSVLNIASSKSLDDAIEFIELLPSFDQYNHDDMLEVSEILNNLIESNFLHLSKKLNSLPCGRFKVWSARAMKNKYLSLTNTAPHEENGMDTSAFFPTKYSSMY